MTSPQDLKSTFLNRANVTGTLRQQLLKTILPLTIVPLVTAGSISWWITEQRSQQEVESKTWNQTMLAADLSGNAAGFEANLDGKQVDLGTNLEHGNLSPSTQIQILDLASTKLLATFTAQGSDNTAELQVPPPVWDKFKALAQELQDQRPSANVVLTQGSQPLYVSRQPSLEGLTIHPFVHEEGVYATSTAFEYGDKYYTVATVPGKNWIAVTTVNLQEIHAASQASAGVFVLFTLLLGAGAAALVTVFARRLTNPLITLSETAQAAAAGDLEIRAEPQGAFETQTLANSFNHLIQQTKALLDQQAAENLRSQALRDISLQMTQMSQSEDILTYAMQVTREALNTDRVILYRFDANWHGTVHTESVRLGWPAAKGVTIADPCFAQGYVSQYQSGRIAATTDIYAANLTECHIQQLAALSVRANLVAPVLISGQLMGLLIAHECSGPREWSDADIEMIAKVATQIGLNLQRAELLEQTQTLAAEQANQRERLQMGLLELLSSVENAALGDLTVRAEVDQSEVGTVADFFNAIIGSLQTIVAQVQNSAEQVTVSVNENEVSIRQLASDAQHQAQELGTSLISIDRMTQSIQTVAANAQEAAGVARSASSVVEVSSAAMDRAVSTILSLRDTVTDTTLKVQRLGESSKQISKVVELINQFALETNMLAINAGIEAARAGEEGRGFAVVAQEVGTLAAQSANATKEIERIVTSIQQETSSLVQAMQSGKTQVEAGSQLIEETKQGLTQIFGVSQQIDGLVQAISSATVEQVSTSESVAELMQQLAQVSERTSDASRSVSDALQQTVAVTQQLQASVRTFKVTQGG